MTNLNNVLRNENVEGGNNMRGQVVIKATNNNSRKAAKMNKELHDVMAKRFMKQKLYNWAPIIRMITITGVDDLENLVADMYNTIGGNSPVMREFVKRNGAVTEGEVDVVQILPDGRKTTRKVTCGEVKGKMRNDYVEDIVLVQFKDLEKYAKGRTKKEKKEASELLVASVLDNGLSIVTDVNGYPDVRIKGQEMEGDVVNKTISPFIWTPSNERNGQILMTSIDHNEAWDILETVGGNEVTKLLKNREEEMPIAKFKKLASRIGLFATPAIKFGKIGTAKHGLLLINRNIVGADDFDKAAKEVLDSVGVEIDDNQYDGAVWFSAEWLSDCFKENGFNISPAQAIWFSAQLRVNKIYAKVFGEAFVQELVNIMAHKLIENLVEGIDYTIIGNRDNISMILDSNGAKLLDLNLKDSCDVYLLDIAKGTQSGTAIQMTDKMAIKDKEATCNFLYRRGIEECHNYVNAIGDTTKSLVEDDINVSEYLINVAKVYNGAIASKVFSDQYIVSGILKDATKKHEAAYRRGRVELNSLFQRALFDNTYVFTSGKLDSVLRVDSRGAIECYSTDVLELNREAIDAIENDNTLNDYEKDMKLREVLSACIIKYPTPGTEEIELVVFLTEKQINRRLQGFVRSGMITKEEALVLYKYFIYSSYGTIKIAADNAMKHKLAGFDTDYDGFAVVFEKELVAIIEKVYVERTESFQESTGSVATHGGVTPFIDCGHDAKNYIELNDKNVNVKDKSVQDEISVWNNIFK